MGITAVSAFFLWKIKTSQGLFLSGLANAVTVGIAGLATGRAAGSIAANVNKGHGRLRRQGLCRLRQSLAKMVEAAQA